jgi:hypothetical protein
MNKLSNYALRIDELAYNLDNISNDDKVKLEDIPEDEIIGEAVYV